jgi:hypothetical protein
MLGLFVAVLHAGASTADDSFVPMAAWGETFLFRLLKSPNVLAASTIKLSAGLGPEPTKPERPAWHDIATHVTRARRGAGDQDRSFNARSFLAFRRSGIPSRVGIGRGATYCLGFARCVTCLRRNSVDMSRFRFGIEAEFDPHADLAIVVQIAMTVPI